MIELCTTIESDNVEIVESGLLYLKSFLSRLSEKNITEHEDIRGDISIRLNLVATYKKLSERERIGKAFHEWSRLPILSHMKEALQTGDFSEFALMWRRHWRGLSQLLFGHSNLIRLARPRRWTDRRSRMFPNKPAILRSVLLD